LTPARLERQDPFFLLAMTSRSVAVIVSLCLAAVCQGALLVPKKAATKRPCHPKKTQFLARAANISSAAVLSPDPTCKTGVLSLSGTPHAGGPQVCCPSYCGECSDYPTCSNVRGQDSKHACCASQVFAQSCNEGAPANSCIPQCSKSTPPCIMEIGETWQQPNTSSAADDCNEAVEDWDDAAEAAVKAAPGGDEQWDDMKRRGVVLKNQTNQTKATSTPKKILVAANTSVKTAMLTEMELGPFTSEVEACQYCFTSHTKSLVVEHCTCTAYTDGGDSKMFCTGTGAGIKYIGAKGGCKCTEKNMEQQGATTCDPF